MCPSPLFPMTHVPNHPAPYAHVPNYSCVLLPMCPSTLPHVYLEGGHATLPYSMSNGAHRWWGSKISNDVKLSKRGQLSKSKQLDYGGGSQKINWHSHILMSILTSHMMVIKNPQSVHRKYFWSILVIFIFNIKLDINICKPHYVNLSFLVNLHCSPDIWLLTFFGNLTSLWQLDNYLNLNHLSLSQGYFYVMLIKVGNVSTCIVITSGKSRQCSNCIYNIPLVTLYSPHDVHIANMFKMLGVRSWTGHLFLL